MKNMQRGYLKFVAAIALLCSTFASFSQTSSFRLKTADSLFQARQYIQSFEHYDHILKQNQYTPAMLLKMAYIQEGLKHNGLALYYLNLYYLTSRDKTALEKMTELATKYNLEGYEATEVKTALSIYHDYHPYISAALSALVLLMFSLTLYTRLQLKKRPVVSFLFVTFFAIALALNIYYGEELTSAIVAKPSTYIMSGPSSGSDVIQILGDGHKVDIIGQHDVWVKVQLDEHIGYVKEDALLPIRL
jgi:hypothetical protein